MYIVPSEARRYVFREGGKAPYPHCDHRVLHSPGACVFCDLYPDEQQERKDAGLKFTDEQKPNEPLLPGEDRSAGSAHKWGGNRPSPYPPGTKKEALDAKDKSQA